MGKGAIELKDYPETHQKGIVSIEQNLLMSTKVGDLGIQIAKDGRIWVCIDGIAAIRFKPLSKETIEFMKKEE
jgi:hypothetical protein